MDTKLPSHLTRLYSVITVICGNVENRQPDTNNLIEF